MTSSVVVGKEGRWGQDHFIATLPTERFVRNMPFVYASCYLRSDISQSNEKEMWEWEEKEKLKS